MKFSAGNVTQKGLHCGMSLLYQHTACAIAVYNLSQEEHNARKFSEWITTQSLSNETGGRAWIIYFIITTWNFIFPWNPVSLDSLKSCAWLHNLSNDVILKVLFICNFIKQFSFYNEVKGSSCIHTQTDAQVNLIYIGVRQATVCSTAARMGTKSLILSVFM